MSDFGTNDYYKHYKDSLTKYQNPVSRKVYGEILKEFNGFVRDGLSNKGIGYVFPHGLGRMELRKSKQEVFIDDNGDVKNFLPVNWKETRKLWNENPAAKEKKVKIKYTNEHTGGYTFRIVYQRSRANYKNKSVYKIRFNREMKRNLSKSIFQGRIDAFLKR